MSGDQKIVAPNRPSRGFKLVTDSAIFGIGGNIERQHWDLAEQIFDCPEQPLRTALCTAIAQLGRDDDARADVVFPDLSDPLRRFALGFLSKSEMMFVSSM